MGVKERREGGVLYTNILTTPEGIGVVDSMGVGDVPFHLLVVTLMTRNDEKLDRELMGGNLTFTVWLNYQSRSISGH